MSSPESRAGPNPEQEKAPYYKAARFTDEKPSSRAYRRAQDLIYRASCELSTYRIQLRTAPGTGLVWHVAVIGERPGEDLEQKLTTILAIGKPTPLPDEVLKILAERRRQAKRLGPWVERHQWPKG
jgi:hypothetical protein